MIRFRDFITPSARRAGGGEFDGGRAGGDTHWRTWLLLAMGAAGLVGAILLWRSAYPSYPALREQGETLIVAIEGHRLRHGAYPSSLAAVGIDPPSHGYGPWQYDRGEAYFSLAVRNYGRDGFVLSYVSGGRGWYLDQ